jgi:hypothetical protein
VFSKNIDDLSREAELVGTIDRIDKIHGFLEQREGVALMSPAKSNVGAHAVVEVGSLWALGSVPGSTVPFFTAGTFVCRRSFSCIPRA